MIEELKVGDKVYIREDLKDGEFYGSVSWQEGKMKAGINTIISVYERGIYILDEIGYFYGSQMIDREKTRELNAEDKSTFDDLIDVAVKAWKDGYLKVLEFERGTVEQIFTVIGGRAYRWHEGDSDYNYAVDLINSLYTETFVIESEEDISRVKSGADIELTNGNKCTFLNQDDMWRIKDDKGFSYNCGLLVLKGATVTQKVK